MGLFRIVLASIYTFVGLSAFLAFCLLKNYPTAVLAIWTGVLSAILLFLHWLDYKRTLPDWYTAENLNLIVKMSVGSLMALIVILVYYLALEIMLRRPIMPIENSLAIPIVWCCIAIKSSLLLSLYGRYYARQNYGQPLLPEAEEAPVTTITAEE